uniref:C-type lectin domain-containing protein n=1 Tax=Biomphalaria glabrata TaxID=6526 RepID=A0A2C9JCB4_BIOGL
MSSLRSFIAVGFLVQCFDCLLSISSTPSTIDVGLTNSLDVLCSYTRTKGQSLEALVALSISRSMNATDFQELALINVFTGNIVTLFTTEAVTGTGRVDTYGDSFINLHWDYPTMSAVGTYQCTAHGSDTIGHDILINNLTSVDYTKPDQDVLLNKIHEMDNALKALQNKMDELRNYSAVVSTLLRENTHLTECCNANSRKVDVLLHSVFAHVVNNSYFLSKENSSHITEAAAVCNRYDGYLVEITSAEQYHVIRDFLLLNSTNALGIFLGARKYGNTWRYSHSFRNVSYFNWDYDEPNPLTNYDCMYLQYRSNLKMFSFPCTSSFYQFYALCEFPMFASDSLHV